MSGNRPWAAALIAVAVRRSSCVAVAFSNHPTERKQLSAEPSTPTFYPGLLYRDADAAIEWLERVLGCERREEHRDEDGNVVHAELDFQGAVVMLGTAGAGREPFSAIPAGNGFLYCALDAIDALYERVREAGGDIAVEITDTDYGSRDFTVRDPEGTLWSFGSYRPAGAAS